MTRADMRLRPLVLGIATLATASLVLTGCGHGGASAAAPAKIGTEPAKGVVKVWAEGGEAKPLPDIVAGFEKANPDVKVEITAVPADDFVAKMTAAVASGTVPDLVYSFSELEPGLIATGGFDEVPDGVVDKSAFFPKIWDLSVVDGKTYGVPWYAYARATYYRTDLLQNAGLEVPKTWDEYTAYAQAMKTAGVQYPISFSVSYDEYTAWDLEILAHQNGGGLIDRDLTKWTINDPKNVQALEYWADFFKKGLASADGPALLDNVAWFTKGQNSSIFEFGSFIQGWFAEANGAAWNDAHLTYAKNPAGPGGAEASGLGGAAWLVPSDAKNKDAAWKLVRYMSEPDVQVAFFKASNDLPAVSAAWDDPALDVPLLQAVRDSLPNGVSSPNVPTWTQVGQVIGKQMERVARGTATAQEALDEAQKQAAAIGLGRKG